MVPGPVVPGPVVPGPVVPGPVVPGPVVPGPVVPGPVVPGPVVPGPVVPGPVVPGPVVPGPVVPGPVVPDSLSCGVFMAKIPLSPIRGDICRKSHRLFGEFRYFEHDTTHLVVVCHASREGLRILPLLLS